MCIFKDDKVLFVYSQGNRVVNDMGEDHLRSFWIRRTQQWDRMCVE